MIQPNEHLLEIYRVTERMDERSQYVRLDRNERVTPFPEPVFRDILASLKPEYFCAYPDPSPLYDRLSRNLGLAADHLYLTNGSDAAIRMILQTYLRASDEIIFPDPTYAMYAIYTRIFRAQAKTVAYDVEMHLNVNQLFHTLQQHPRILALANPDQPTGAVMSVTTLERLVATAREVGTLVIIDEAYYPFYPHSAVNLVSKYDNVAITRTFSKVGGLAGLRIGYFAAHPSIVDCVQRIRGAHEVNAMAIAVASYVLDHPELGESFLAEVEAGRQVLAAAARELSLGFPSCPTNFQLLQIRGVNDTVDIVAALKRKGYLVKGAFSSPAVRNCIRITLAGPDIMHGFADALKSVLR
ncbi:MAG: histidinol-phosphate aminotransferase family protein [Chloroflexi bacterium]|nr:histidinol-phosphate aminotransferase family protein [Chloroflexota bacterium]